jgi:valyl-tRNA synthetase
MFEFINIFTDDGNKNENEGPQFEGMPRFTAQLLLLMH